MTRLRTTGAAVALAALAGLGLAACGSESAGGSGPRSTEEEVSTALTEENFLDEISAAQEEVGSAHMVLTADDDTGGFRIEGDIALDGSGEPRMQAELGLGEEGSGAMRLVDGTVHLSYDDVAGGKFIEIPGDDPSHPLAGTVSGLTESADPGAQLELMRKHVTSIEQTGETEELDGVTTTPWVVTVDAAALLAEQAELAGVDAEDELDEAPDEVTFVIHVGPDTLPRRFVSDIAGEEAVADVSEWGKEVTVEKPSADEITDEDPFADLDVPS